MTGKRARSSALAAVLLASLAGRCSPEAQAEVEPGCASCEDSRHAGEDTPSLMQSRLARAGAQRGPVGLGDAPKPLEGDGAPLALLEEDQGLKRPLRSCWRPLKECVAEFFVGLTRKYGCVYRLPWNTFAECPHSTSLVAKWSRCEPAPCAPELPPGAAAARTQSSINFPLRTEGRFIVDSGGTRVKWSCVNWYGAHMIQATPNGLDLRSEVDIAQTIKNLGFNCVRLPYSVANYFNNPVVRPEYIAAMSTPGSKTFLDVLDAAVAALTGEGLMVIMNSHNSDNIWCCSENDGNGLWFTANWTSDAWINTIYAIVQRYSANPWVVGHDTRNEVRPDLSAGVPKVGLWSIGMPTTNSSYTQGCILYDLRLATEQAATAILTAQPEHLVVVEPVGALFLCEPTYCFFPIRIPGIDNKLVWSFHDYEWADNNMKLTESLCKVLKPFNIGEELRLVILLLERLGVDYWDPIHRSKNYTDFVERRMISWAHIALSTKFLAKHAPIWIGEMGINVDNEFWQWLIAFLDEYDMDFAYWSVDGSSWPAAAEGFGETSGRGFDESYGILNTDFQTVRYPWMMTHLNAIQQPSLGKTSGPPRAYNSSGLIPR